MPVNVDDIMAKMSPEERESIERRTEEVLAELDGLEALRKLSALTQRQMAETLHISQPNVHKLERQTDLYLSTLRRFVEAAGGELEIRVSLPEKGTFKLTGVGELAV